MSEKITKDNIAKHLIQKELDYIGKTIDEVKDDPEWYHNNAVTEEQYNEWREYSLALIKKVLKIKTKEQLEHTFSWFNLGQGLRVIKNEEKPE